MLVAPDGPAVLIELGYLSNESDAAQMNRDQWRGGVARAIADSHSFSVIGGEETGMVINRLKLKDKIGFLSTGGGAMLEYLAGKKLPGIEALK